MTENNPNNLKSQPRLLDNCFFSAGNLLCFVITEHCGNYYYYFFISALHPSLTLFVFRVSLPKASI